MPGAKQLLGIIIDNVVGRLPKGLFTDGKFIHMNAEIIEINQESKKIVLCFFFFFSLYKNKKFSFPDNILNELKYRSHLAWTFGLHSAK